MDGDMIIGLLSGLLFGFILGSIGWAAMVYTIRRLKDWSSKRKNIKLGRNLKRGPTPKLLSLEE